MRWIALTLLAGFVLSASGCSKSNDAVVEAPKQVPPPEAAVQEFLEAIRVGDHKKAESMMTDLAREKTAKADLMVAPPGSPTAKFEIAGVQVVENQVAHVGSIWTDVGEDGKPQQNEFVWALRLEPAGWRVAGVAVELFPNQPPLLLDFEDPEDMMRKQQMAEAEMQRQMNPQNVQAGGANVAAGNGAPGLIQPTGAATPLSAQPQNGAAGAVAAPNGTPTTNATTGQAMPPAAAPPGNSVNPASFSPTGNTVAPGSFSPNPFPGGPAPAAPLQAEQPGTTTPR